jgi:hypothetical protein
MGTVLESYTWERDQGAHLDIGIVPAALSGLVTEAEQVSWFPNPATYWILVSGVVGGSSGRVIGGSAALFEISPQQTKTPWRAAPNIGNIVAYAHSGRFEIEYADGKRFYTNLPHARLLDIYQVDYTKRTLRRLVHQPLD